MPGKKEYLIEHGIYPESFKAFEKDLRRKFKKKKDLISLNRIRQATGKHPNQIKKYLEKKHLILLSMSKSITSFTVDVSVC